MIQAINPNAIKECKLEDVIFNIGIVPYGKRVEIESSAYFNKDAKTEEEVRAMLGQSYQFIQWGVKGHSNFKYQDGTVVEFKSTKVKLGELEYSIVSEETMSIYAVSGLLTDISELVSSFNYQKADVVKN